MSMIYLYTGRYSQKLVEEYPRTHFVFGDNRIRRGNGGQACIRPCKNTLGVVTKHEPSNAPGAFFEEGDPLAMRSLARDLLNIEQLMEQPAAAVVLPVLDLPDLPSSLGCGLAQLPSRAPTMYAMINSWQRRLTTKYHTSIIRRDLSDPS